jgi:acyl carrier protein
MSREELLNSVTKLMVEVSFGRLSISDIMAESKIIDELGFDSLDFAELMLHCESVTYQKVDESSINWREVITVNDLIGLFVLDAG